MFGVSEVAVLIIVAVLVLGAKKLPELARSAGKSVRILKSEARAMKAERGGGPPSARYAVRPAPDEQARVGREENPGSAAMGS